MDKLHFDLADYSVVVKNSAPPPSSWKWKIYRAGRSSPIKQSSVYFHTMVTANRAGKRGPQSRLAVGNWSGLPPIAAVIVHCSECPSRANSGREQMQQNAGT
jgi:hypothetical protein